MTVSMGSPKNTGWDSSHILVTLSQCATEPKSKKGNPILLKQHAGLKGSSVEFS